MAAIEGEGPVWYFSLRKGWAFRWVKSIGLVGRAAPQDGVAHGSLSAMSAAVDVALSGSPNVKFHL